MTTPSTFQEFSPVTTPVVTETYRDGNWTRFGYSAPATTALARKLRGMGITAVRVVFDDDQGFHHESDFGTKELCR